jgi:phospholipid transport system substrate-binding protein
MARYWSQATPQQRRQISEEMLQLMVRTYTRAMFTFRNQPIALVDEKIINPRSAVVRVRVTTTSGQDASVVLRMENRADRWQVIDVVVDGVSMVITYRGTFAEEISKSGIDGLIASVRQDNLQRVDQ